jgi:hypothetical protein
VSSGSGAAGRLVARDADTSERLCADDMATRREEENLAVAMAAHAQRVRATPASEPGVCCNCGGRCLPHTVYCDADCRGEHEQRERVLARQGRRA